MRDTEVVDQRRQAADLSLVVRRGLEAELGEGVIDAEVLTASGDLTDCVDGSGLPVSARDGLLGHRLVVAQVFVLCLLPLCFCLGAARLFPSAVRAQRHDGFGQPAHDALPILGRDQPASSAHFGFKVTRS
jgi:hypothetical protein